jgi:archaellum biogenesis ATPase FlaH
MSAGDYQSDQADDWYADVIATPGSDAAPNRPGPRVTTFSDALESLMSDLECGEPPVEWTPDDKPWASLAVRSGDIHVIGGPPAVGKTSLALNLFDRMLARYPDLRILIASNEMTTATMNERLISMRSGIAYQAIRRRDESAYTAADLERVKAEVAAVSSRLGFVERPFTIEQVHDAAVDFNADIVFVDYLQATGMAERSRDAQQRVAATMRALRALADTGPCVIATAALSRTGIARAQGRVGKTDANALDMGVFLHASEIEHEANVGHLLLAEPGAKVAMGPGEEDEPVRMWLQCVKARDSAKTITPLLFDGRIQKFTVRDVDAPPAKRTAPSRTKPEAKPKNRSAGKSGGSGVLKDGETRWL